MIVQLNPRYLTDSTGKRTFVVLPIGEYEELLEDLHDLAILAERRGEPTVSLEELELQLRTSRSLSQERARDRPERWDR